MKPPGGVAEMRNACVFLTILIATVLAGCAHQRVAIDELHLRGCETTPEGASPWHITSLYDCDSRSLFVPWQLWTGAAWTGDKTQPCMHRAKTRFFVNGGDSTTIEGPIPWKHPQLGETLQTWHRTKDDGRKQQIFTCHAKGIGRVYDSRKPQTYAPGRCKFPAGFGWQLFEKRPCNDTSIEIIEVELNPANELAGLHFRWWFGDTLDHVYRYAPGVSMTKATRMPRHFN